MLTSTLSLLEHAQGGRYAVGAFNVYNLEGVLAVIGAAEAEQSPVVLQIHPSAFRFGGLPLIALCRSAAEYAPVLASVHLDHSAARADIVAALEAGVSSVMADGSHLPYEANADFTADMVRLALEHGASVEAELGRLSGTEDGLSIPEYEALLTDPDQAAEFVQRSGTQALAVCIGNVHGHYRTEPQLDYERLGRIRERVAVPLVLHGASGLPDEMVRRAIELGVCKFNVNTEVREAYLGALQRRFSKTERPELLDAMGEAVSAMREVVAAKMRLFGSSGRV